MRTPRSARCPQGCTGVHSYTSDDVRWCWPGAMPGRQALDVELVTDTPPAVAAGYPDAVTFFRAWTQLEVVAKLTDTPALTLVGRGCLGQPPPAGVEVE
ncbi:MAG: hypothetical protein GX596_05860, partial [Propionibacterium sp.]|nr:hypothetical protein [Propionibacterium sp.]